MAIRTIITEPNKLLRQISKPVNSVGKEEQKLMDDMLETMYDANGIGLAAIQVGVPKRIIVMDISKDENKKETADKKIKYNSKILHQSKLINYFNGDYAKSKIEEDLDKFLKKIKKDKKYFLSKKDIIFLEALKSDGVEISKKYDGLYEVKQSEMPADIQKMIDNNEIGAALLRIIEVIGPDKIENIDEDTVYFIINTLNQLNVDLIRNKLLLKVLPLKV